MSRSKKKNVQVKLKFGDAKLKNYKVQVKLKLGDITLEKEQLKLSRQLQVEVGR